jgi:hypothetical protein
MALGRSGRAIMRPERGASYGVCFASELRQADRPAGAAGAPSRPTRMRAAGAS